MAEQETAATAEASSRRAEADPTSADAPAQGEIDALVRTLRALASDSTELLATDARLFLQTVLIMLASAVVIAVLVVSVWLYLGLSAALLAIQIAGMPAWLGVLLAAVGNLLAMGALLLWLRRLAGDLTFRETRAAIGNLLSRGRAERNGDEG